jgi:S-DNA-T family DNA segregation ATPase FtsK/SpoIIIE
MAIKVINVTQLKYACLDPEWLRKWLNGEKPSAKFHTPSGTITVYGTVFHKIAEKFVNWLVSTKKAVSLSDEISLWTELYERFAEKELSELLEADKIDSAYHLGECLKAFCKRVSELRQRCKGFKLWQDVYVIQEFSIKDVHFPIEENSIFISGQIDAVRTHPEHGLEIADYKLSHGANLKHDLLQMAIYAKLLNIVKPGLKFQGVLEYYEPQLHEVCVSVRELEDIFQEMVEPVLHKLVSEAMPKSSQIPLPAAQVPLSASDDLSDAIRKCYAAFKLDVEIMDKHEAPQLIRYRAKPAAGVKVVSLANRAEDLQVALSLKYPPLIEPAQGCVTIDIPKEKPDTVWWKELVRDSVYAAHRSFISFPVGIGIDNQVIIADFADPNMCHALIAGTSGSGKSEFLKSMVASLIAKNTPDTLKLSIIDPKILTFSSLSGCPYLTCPIITDISSAISRLWKAVEEMDMRYRQLNREGLENLSSRFLAGKTDIPFYVIVFDEFADLILAGNEEKKEFERLVARLASKGRAAGIHLVLTTQRPDSKIVTGLIKANLPLKICLRVTTASNSQIILDQNGGESLLGRGDLLCHLGKGIERAQSPYISQEELLQYLNKGKAN